MPINKELRDLYPANWQEIRQRILERAGHSCEYCGLADGAFGYRDADGEFQHAPADDAAGERLLLWSETIPEDAKLFAIKLTVAHLEHDPRRNSDADLAALCCQCHNRHDGLHRARNRSKTRDRRRGQERFWQNP